MIGQALRILVDQDDVIAEWGRGYDAALDSFGADAEGIPRYADRTGWDLSEGRTKEEQEIIRIVMRLPGFYEDLEPVPGARAALRHLVKQGHDVRIVTAPYISNRTCASDKLNWIDRHYGGDWASRVIITSDKTLVRGDVLIDDKPLITGDAEPTWQHVLFDRPWNQHVENKHVIHTWSHPNALERGLLSIVNERNAA